MSYGMRKALLSVAWGGDICALAAILQHDGELTSLVVIPLGVQNPHEEPALLLESPSLFKTFSLFQLHFSSQETDTTKVICY